MVDHQDKKEEQKVFPVLSENVDLKTASTTPINEALVKFIDCKDCRKNMLHRRYESGKNYIYIPKTRNDN